MIINKKDYTRIVGLICIILVFAGCKKVDDYLNKAESGGETEQQIFGNYVQTEAFLTDIYATGIGSGDWLIVNNAFTFTAATDDARCQYNYAYAPGSFTNGTLSPTNNPIDVWAKQYQNIRKVNNLLVHIDGVPPSDDPNKKDGKTRIKGEAYFLRAFFYLELYKRYGAVPIVKYPLAIDDNLNIARSTDDELVSFIVSDCDSAALLLPLTYTADNLGRATRGAAMMIKATTLLFSASPLHNEQNNQEKWVQAAKAAKAVMDLQTYHLADNYKNMLHSRTSPGTIFQSTINQVWQVTPNDWVRIMQPPSQGGGWANTQPLQNLVDEYEMKNGLPITDPLSGYSPDDPYKDRDPRFYQTVIYNGCKWAGSTINTYVGSGVDGLNYKTGSTQTGYYMGGKMLDENSTLISSYRPGSHFWVFMRYAETLLDYAEAQNEAAGPDPSVYDAINQIRDRPGVNMPHLPGGLSKEKMREYIRHERRVEMALEPSRFWDVRRWRIGEQVMKAAYGMRVVKNPDATFTYGKFLVEDRIYKPAFDLFPIPQSEMERNKALVQNPGY